MSNTPSSQDRRESSTPLIATLTLIFTVLLSTLAWSGANPTAAEETGFVIAAAPAAPSSAVGADVADVDPGCGSAEPCVVQAP